MTSHQVGTESDPRDRHDGSFHHILNYPQTGGTAD